MARKLEGSFRTRGGRVLASVPEATGSKVRVEVSFDTQEEADRWVSAQIGRLKAGKPVIKPAEQRRVGVTAAPVDPVAAATGFAVVAHEWRHDRYYALEKAEAGRVADVEGDLRNHLVPAFADLFDLEPLVARALVIDWVRTMAGKKPKAAASPFKPAEPPYAKSTVTEMLWVLREIVDFGHKLGLGPALPLDGIAAIDPVDRPSKRVAPLISLADTAAYAAKLHVIHQVTLWLLRLTGLRISEAFGLRVGSFIVDDDGTGFLLVERQAGRTFIHFTEDRSGVERAHRSETVKRKASYRLIAIPASLTRVLIDLIAAYHTAPDGTVDLEASLIPPIRKKDGGAPGFRSALKVAGLLLDKHDDAPTSIVPHDFRKAVGTDLGWSSAVSDLLQRRHLGHRAGGDVTSLVYTLDSRLKSDLVPAAQVIQREIVGAGIDRLIVPTMRMPSYGTSLYPKERRTRIDAKLAELGWQVRLHDDHMNTAEAAATLGMSESATRRLFPDDISAIQDAKGTWWATRDDVIAYRERWAGFVTIHDIADDLGASYHQVYGLAKLFELIPVRDERARRSYYTTEQAEVIAAEHDRMAALAARAVTVADAAAMLGTRPPAVEAWANNGRLEYDPERDRSGRAHVTRASIEAELARRSGRRPDEVSVAAFKDATGFDTGAVSGLVRTGLLVRSGRKALTAGSVQRWCVAYRPDLLTVLGGTHPLPKLK